ncbi:MAG: RNA 2',3'-cyclic phosphodiesterase [Deltaproteobacteria bacterium]|nr:RNA 2',3'-cyclic phosphodiesterase [Deltaproteobacteria bacterium]
MGIRSFLAFDLPPQIRQVLLNLYSEVSRSSLNAKWVRPESIHLTMVFMGEIREADLPLVIDAIGEVCLHYGPFPTALQSMGSFPSSRNPRVLWLGVDTDLERMSRFRDDLEQRLLPFGIQVEKRGFHPHLTLGRFKKLGKKTAELEELLSKHRGLTSALCSLNELILFRSDLRPAGAVYTKIESWALTGHQ